MNEKIYAKEKKQLSNYLIPLLCVFITLLLLFFSDNIKIAIKASIMLVSFNIVPTLFPFFVLCDLWISHFNPYSKSYFSSLFQKIFHVSPLGMSLMLLGMICGFPLGVKTAVEYYSTDLIDKEDLGVLCGFINNPSLAFVISGVGLGLYKNIYDGLIFYFAIILSSLMVGFIYRPQKAKHQFKGNISRQKFVLSSSIVNAAFSCIKIGSFIIFFSAIIGLFSAITSSEILTCVVASLCEVGNAVSIVFNCNSITLLQRKVITAFALGFSGISVHMQTFSLLPKEISRKKYLKMKFLQGILSASLIFITNKIF